MVNEFVATENETSDNGAMSYDEIIKQNPDMAMFERFEGEPPPPPEVTFDDEVEAPQTKEPEPTPTTQPIGAQPAQPVEPVGLPLEQQGQIAGITPDRSLNWQQEIVGKSQPEVIDILDNAVKNPEVYNLQPEDMRSLTNYLEVKTKDLPGLALEKNLPPEELPKYKAEAQKLGVELAQATPEQAEQIKQGVWSAQEAKIQEGAPTVGGLVKDIAKETRDTFFGGNTFAEFVGSSLSNNNIESKKEDAFNFYADMMKKHPEQTKELNQQQDELIKTLDAMKIEDKPTAQKNVMERFSDLRNQVAGTEGGREKLKELNRMEEVALNKIESSEDYLPTAMQAMADATELAVDLGTAGIFSGGKAATKGAVKATGKGAGKILSKKALADVTKGAIKGAGTGAVAGTLQTIEEGATTTEEIKEGTKTGIIYGGLFGGTAGLQPTLKQKQVNQLREEVDDLVGKITLEKDPKKLAKHKESLRQIKSKDIETFEDLSDAQKGKASTFRDAQDDIYGKYTDTKKMDDLATTAGKGEDKVSVNHVQGALDDLKVLYAKDPENLSKVNKLEKKAKASGLTVGETNQIARDYNTEFNKKGFDAKGDPKTSVTANNFENTRSGIKDKARSMLNKEDLATSKVLDEEMSKLLGSSQKVQKASETAQNVKNRAQKRGLVEKGGRLAGKIINGVTLGLMKGAAREVIGLSGKGEKTLDTLTLEKMLSSNLKKLDKLDSKLQKIDTGKRPKDIEKDIITAVKEAFGDFGDRMIQDIIKSNKLKKSVVKEAVNDN